MEYFDLSHAQKTVLFSNILNPGSTSFYLDVMKDFPLEDLDYLKEAVNIISSNYLNTQFTFFDESNEYKQYYADVDEGIDKFNYYDISTDEYDVYDFISNLDNSFTTLLDTPLYKWSIIKTRDKVVLVGLLHHIIVDGTSIWYLIPRELGKCISKLRNNERYEKICDVSYEVYVKREKEYLNSKEAQDDRKFWLDNLKDYSNDVYQFKNNSMGTYEVEIPEDLTKKLNQLNNIDNTRISPFVLALSTASLYFAKSKDILKDLVWNTSVNGRYFGEDISQMIGMFVNILPLRIKYDEERTFKELLLYVKSVLKQGLTHGKLQFDEYSSNLRSQKIDPKSIGMYSIVSNSSIEDIETLNLKDETDFPFHIRVNLNRSDKDGLQLLTFEYIEDYLSRNQVEGIANGLLSLLNQVGGNPSIKCGEYDVDVNEFFMAEEYFTTLVKSFDNSTVISPDTTSKKDKQEYSLKTLTLNEDVYDLITKYCEHNSLGIDELLSAIFLFNLTKYSFSKDILISRICNRNNGVNSYPTAFNELPVGYKFNTDISVNEFLSDYKEVLSKNKQYSFYPLLSNQSVEYDSEIMYNYIDNDLSLNYNNLNQVIDEVENYIDLDKFKIMFLVVKNKNTLNLSINYDMNYYSDELIQSFLDTFNLLISKFTSTPTKLLKDISICEENDSKDFEIKLVNEGIINKIFERQVESNPDKVILEAIDGTYTYEELNNKANSIANSLISKGVNVEDKIMFMMKRDSNLIATVLGIIKAGCAFIPIDPKYPKERINQILSDSGSRYIIVSDDIECDMINKLNVNELLEETNTSNPDTKVTPDNLCFIIYTSGSTGKPKGVMLTHRGISNYIANHPKNIPIYDLNKNCSKMISISTVSFIVFLREIFGTILNGLPVVFANEEQSINPLALTKLFRKTNADAFGSTPTRLLEYLKLEEIQDVIGKCKFIIVGGEGFPPRLYDEIRKYSNANIYNSYGPTEVTIASHGKLVESNNITAGFPMLNVKSMIMDIDGNRLPPYVTGEIYVGGAGIARGYYNNPEKTREVFMNIDNVPFYNTGDLGKVDDNGELSVLGRNDTQIKLRGLRIELSEIEGVVANYPDINATTVIVKEINSLDYLCAYYTKASDKKLDKDDLRDYLEGQLPDYMVPHYLIELDKFPTTPNGKTDFKKLPEPEINSIEDEYVAPKGVIEEKITSIVEEILGIDKISVTTDLFTLGLTSLSVIELSSAIYNEYSYDISVISIINNKTIRKIASSIDVDKKEDNTKVDDTKLTSNQLGIYFESIKHPDRIGYNLPKMIKFDSSINPYKLRDSIISAINLHPYMKTRIMINDNGDILQTHNEDGEIDDIPICNVDVLTNDMINEFIKAFEVVDNQLFRFKIYTTPTNTILLSDFHHLIVDGTSLNILFKDITSIYDNKNKLETEVNDAYTLIKNENNFIKTDMYEESAEFFDNMLRKFDEVTILTPNLQDDGENGELETYTNTINKDVVDKFCRKQKISPNTLFMSATVLALTKYVSNKNVLISTLFSGRDNPKYLNTIGMLVKTLPIAFNTERDMSIKSLFKLASNNWMNIINYSSYPYMELVEKYNLYPDFFYGYHGKIIEDVEVDGKTYQRESLEHNSIRYKLNLNVVEVDDNYSMNFDYNNTLYSFKYIKDFANAIKTIIEKFIKSENTLDSTKISDIAIIDENRKVEFEDIPITKLNKLFEKAVNEHPDDIAIVTSSDEITFDELNCRANRLAHALINRGVESGSRILHMLPRGIDLVIASIGIVKAGCGFVPLATDYPEERINYIYKNSEADYIISDFNLEGAISVDTLLSESSDESNPDPVIEEDDIAYMIYTSGSTGNPKGIMITHKNITNLFMESPNNYYRNVVEEVDSSLAISAVSFDLSIGDLIAPLIFGKKVVLANDDEVKDIFALTKLMEKEKPEFIFTTPSRLTQYLEFDNFKEQLSNMKVILVGGEKFNNDLPKMLSDFPDLDLYNIYGPAETIILSNMKIAKPEFKEYTVGRQLLNYITEVRDIDGKLLPEGVMGEVYIGGNCVSKGYYNNKEKTDAAYLTINNMPYYKSGDYGIMRENNDLLIIGRLDNQVKLRGLRIETGEIESVISSYEYINNVIVVIRKINDMDYLCAYYTGSCDIDKIELKEFISQKLTPYMVPSVFMQLDTMPKTPNGKTDVKNLPDPELMNEYVKPENDIEALFATIFEDILGLDKVGVEDNFFEIGGNSLSVTKITLAAMNEGYDINYADVFSNPTPRQLANLIIDGENSVKGSDDNIKDYDYRAINNILKKNNIKNFDIDKCSDSLGDILLTGATGFLGIHILRELIENESGDIYCLLRARKSLSSKDRLQSLLFYYFQDNYDDVFDTRIHIIDGDITNPDDFKKLTPYNINTIINAAGNVKHFSAGSDIEDINYNGVVNGLEFAKSKNSKFVQISTASIAGESINNYPSINQALSEDELYIGQSVDNQYLGSKFLAEREVLNARAEHGLDVKIMRVGNLMARSSDSEFQINFNSNGFINRLKSYITIGEIPYTDLVNNVEFSPIDITAKAIIALAKTPKDCIVFHPYNNHLVSYSDVMDIIKPLDLNIDVVSENVFEESLERVMSDKDKQEGISGLLTSIGSGKVKKQWVKVDNNYTIQVLYMMSIRWPLISEEYIYNFIKFLDELEFFTV